MPWTTITDDAVPHVQQLAALEIFQSHGSFLSAAVVTRLSQYLPNLWMGELMGTPGDPFGATPGGPRNWQPIHYVCYTALGRSNAASADGLVAIARQMMWRSWALDHPMQAHVIDSTLMYRTYQMPDGKDGFAAFLEKRAPVFHAQVSKDLPQGYPWWQEPELK